MMSIDINIKIDDDNYAIALFQRSPWLDDITKVRDDNDGIDDNQGDFVHLVKDGLVPPDHVLELNVQNCLQYHLVSDLEGGWK